MILSEEARKAAETELEETDQLIAEAERRGLFRTPTFREFVERRNPTLLDFEHVPRTVDLVERVLDGFEARRAGEESDAPNRILVCEPPRYLKSEVFSRLLPAYFLRRFPSLLTGLASYGADLAWELSEEARENYTADGGVLRGDTKAKKRWATEERGELWASGVGGPILGRGYHLGVVDDPIDPEKAGSPTYQRRFKKWWSDKFLSRQEPHAVIFFVMQRLGTEDPVDHLFRREVGDGTPAAPERWHVVILDEIKSDEPLGRYDGPRGLPPTCTLHPDPRRTGQVLAPSRFDREQVEKMQNSAGPYTAAAQRQQRPMRPSGDYWQRKWFAHGSEADAPFRTYVTLPTDAYNGGKDWDTAYTKDERNSASAYVESYRGPGEDGQFLIYVENVDWDWIEFPDLVGWMAAEAGPHYVEQKATGKSVVQTLEINGVAAEEVAVKGDKLARANAVQRAVANRRVLIREEVVNDLLLGERQGLLRVTAEQLMANGEGLDLNDAFVQALSRHVGIGVEKKPQLLWNRGRR